MDIEELNSQPFLNHCFNRFIDKYVYPIYQILTFQYLLRFEYINIDLHHFSTEIFGIFLSYIKKNYVNLL
jgi:hypothetical protein